MGNFLSTVAGTILLVLISAAIFTFFPIGIFFTLLVIGGIILWAHLSIKGAKEDESKGFWRRTDIINKIPESVQQDLDDIEFYKMHLLALDTRENEHNLDGPIYKGDPPNVVAGKLARGGTLYVSEEEPKEVLINPHQGMSAKDVARRLTEKR